MASNTPHQRITDDVKEKKNTKHISARHRYKTWGNVSFFSDESESVETAVGHPINPTLSSQLSYRKLSMLVKSTNLPENHHHNWSKISFAFKRSILGNSIYNNPQLSNPLIVQNRSFNDVTVRLFPKMWKSLKSRLIHGSPKSNSSEAEESGIIKKKTSEKDSTKIGNTVRPETKDFIEKSLDSSRHHTRRNSFTDNMNCQAFSLSRQQCRRRFSEGSNQYLVIPKPADSGPFVPEPSARYLVDSIGAISIDFLEDCNRVPNKSSKIQSLPEPLSFLSFHNPKRPCLEPTVCINDKRASTLVVGFDDLEQQHKNVGWFSHAFGRSKQDKPTVYHGHAHEAEVLTIEKLQQDGGLRQPKQPARYREDSIGGVSISFLNATPKKIY